jgi:hypothetical protein
MRNRLVALLWLGTSYLSICAAQTAPPSSAPERSSQTFAEAKAQHLARLQQEVGCVEAATSFETMHACMPPPPSGRMGPPPSQQQKQ